MEKQEYMVSDNLVAKIVSAFFCKSNHYEGDYLDLDFFRQNIDSTIEEEQVEKIKTSLSDYIYNWFDQNKETKIGEAGREISIKTFLSRYIKIKAKEKYPNLSTTFTNEITDKIDSIIDRRKYGNILMNEDIITLENDYEKESISYLFASKAFYALTTYMMENDSDYFEGMKNTINQAILSTEKEDGEAIQKIFFITDSSTTNVFSEDGEVCLFYKGGYDIVPASLGLMALEVYVSQSSYTNMMEVLNDPNIQYGNKEVLNQILEENSANDKYSKGDNVDEIESSSLSEVNEDLYIEPDAFLDLIRESSDLPNNSILDGMIEMESGVGVDAALAAIEMAISEDLSRLENAKDEPPVFKTRRS